MKIPIVATSLLKFGYLWDFGVNDLIREAGIKALENAKTTSKEIDSLFISNVFSSKVSGQSILNSIAFEELGISNSICIQAGDASGATAIREAANSIIAGKSNIAMVIGFEKISDVEASNILSLTSDLISQQESFIGGTVVSQFAILTRKYMNDFKLKIEDFSFIPSNNHMNGLNNEYAQFRFELTEEKINSSPMSADPIRLLDCATYCDGAAALIMCDEKTAKKFGKIDGYLLSSSLATDSLSLAGRKSITTIEPTVKAAHEAFSNAGLAPADINLMEVHDFVPVSEVLAVEDLGFAKKGQGINFIKENKKKINQSGGLKACGHALGATGVRQAIDIIARLNSHKLKYGLTHTLGGTGCISVVNIFGV